MGPVRNQRVAIAFLSACLALAASVHLGNRAQAADSKWGIDSLEEVPQMEVKVTAPSAKLLDDIMVDRQLAEVYEVYINDGDYTAAVTALKDVIHRLEKVVGKNDVRILSCNYSLAWALVQPEGRKQDNKLKQAVAILGQALRLELENEQAAQRKDRKYISDAERASEGMETTSEFESRYKSSIQLVKVDLEAAMHNRSMVLFWNGRSSDALRLASIGTMFLAEPGTLKTEKNRSNGKSKANLSDALYVQALAYWGTGDFENFHKTEALFTYLLKHTNAESYDLRVDLLHGLSAQSERKFDEAEKNFQTAIEKSADVAAKTDNSHHPNQLDLNLLKQYLGNNFLLRDEPLKAYETYELIYEAAKRLDKGKPDSVVYSAIYLAALDGMRSSVLARYTRHIGAGLVGSGTVPPIFAPSNLSNPMGKLCSTDPASPVLSTTAPELSPDEYRRLAGDLYTVGYQHKLKRKQKVAREMFYRSLKVYDEHLPHLKREIAGILYDLAESYYWSKQNDTAASVMSRCLAVRKEIDPVSSDTKASLNQLGRMYQGTGDCKEAVSCFREALALACREKEMATSRVYRMVADMGQKSNDPKAALLASRVESGFDSGSQPKLDSETIKNLGEHAVKRSLDTTYDAQNMHRVCEWPLTKQLNAVAYAVSSSPKSERSEIEDLWHVLADAYNIGKYYDEAHETSLRLLELRKKDAQAQSSDPPDLTDDLWQLAYICSVSYRLEDAKRYFDEVVKNHKPMGERTTGYLHYTRALVADSVGDAKTAVADFRMAVKCLKNYLPTLDPLEDAEELDHTRWLIFDIEQELKAKQKRGPDAPDYYGAYSYTKWARDRFPLKICIDRTSEHGFGPKLHQSFCKSIDEWMSASDLTSDSPLSYVLIDDKEQADIYLERVDSYDQIPYGSGGGATAKYVMKDGKLTNDLDLVHLRVFCATPDPEELSNYAIAHLETLVLHELGHAFGLGHSSSGLDVMYWKSAMKNLSHRDKATLLRIYGCQVARKK